MRQTIQEQLAGIGLTGSPVNNVRSTDVKKPIKKASDSVAKKRYQIKQPAKATANLIADGVDHINIHDDTQTELGTFLRHASEYSFDHDHFGKFNTVESFWYYIQSEERDDRLRTLSGRGLKNFNKQLTPTFVVNFRAVIMDANWQKLKQYPEYIQMMKESDLPFECYYVNSASGFKIRPSFFKWLIAGFEEIRTALKEEREPSFNFLLDSDEVGIYDKINDPRNKQKKKIKQLPKEESLGED